MDQIYEWMLLFVRAGGLVALMPGISAEPVPVQVRVAIAGFLAYAATGFVHPPIAAANNLGTLFVAVCHEMLIGLLLGFGARMIFYAVDFAGQLMSTELGLQLAPAIDPFSHERTTAVGTLIYYLSIVLFFVSDSHHLVIAAFMRSFAIAPAGIPVFTHNVAEFFIYQTGNIFLIALQMAAPIMAVNFTVTFTFAILGKAAPGMSVFQESYPIRILVGLSLLGITLGLTAQIVLSHLRESPEIMLRFLP